jgi:hypothetical protein
MSKNNNEIPNAMFLGVFDADGSVLICIDDLSIKGNKENIEKQPFSIRIVYEFSQSNSKQDLVIKVAEKFGGSITTNQKSVFRVSPTKEVGNKVRELLLETPPRHPGRFRDFLLSEQILSLLNQEAQKTKSGLVTLIQLAYNNSVNRVARKTLSGIARKHPIQYWFDKIKLTEKEFNEGMDSANLILESVEKKVSVLETELLNTKFSSDYILGAHFGDGGFTVALGWNPTNKAFRLRCIPEWTISGENEAYCQAFVHSLPYKSDVNKAGPNYFKFRVSGIAECRKVLSIFDNIWLPDYKQNQYQTFKKAVELLSAKKHFSKEGIITLVDLVYTMSEKGSRSQPKETYIKWGIQWLEENKYL